MELRNFPQKEAEASNGGLEFIKFDKDAPIKEGISYSNPMYILLGMVIEAETGKNLDAVIRDEVIDRYNLSNTFTVAEFKSLPSDEKENFNGSENYNLGDNGNVYSLLEYDGERLAGNMISTPRDLTKFLKEIATDPILQPMTEGTGMFTDIEWQGKKHIGHTGGGGGPGALAAAGYTDPENGDSFVLMATRVVRLEKKTINSTLTPPTTLSKLEGHDEELEHIKERTEGFLAKKGINNNANETEPDDLKSLGLPAFLDELAKEVKAIRDGHPLSKLHSAEHEGTITDKNAGKTRGD